VLVLGVPAGVLAVFVAVIILCAAAIVWLAFRRPTTPEELERRRRLAIYRGGKMGDGEIVDVEAASIVYSYSVAGVGYTASQDVTGLEGKLPADKMAIIGSVSIKFDPRNPANSIVLCEEWSGLRNR
jgi:hypothetical protein